MDSVTATVSIRQQRGAVVEDRDWGTAPVDLLQSACPWRTFRWYKGQKHYSGTYWSATMRDHVIYESRLELSRLLFADFDPLVRGIVAQPFLLKTLLERAERGRAMKLTPFGEKAITAIRTMPGHSTVQP
jgi:hypothetical protein